MVNAKEMALAAAKALDSKKGRDIKVLEIDKITTLADIVICIFYRLLLRGICQFFGSTLFIQVFIFRHKFLLVVLILFYTNSCYLLDFLNIAVAALVKDRV